MILMVEIKFVTQPEGFENFDVYASGPPPMINAIQKSFPENGLEQGHFYFDSFEYANDGD